MKVVDPKKEKFKYKPSWIKNYIVVSVFPTIKRCINSLKSRITLSVRSLDWKVIRGDLSSWLFDILSEGLIFNAVTAILFGAQFTILTIFAHGALLKGSISYWWKLRRDGTTTKIPKKE